MLSPSMLLKEGIAKLDLTVSVSQQEQLLQFLHLLNKWNQAFNLTAIKSLDQMVIRHVLDSLSMSPYLHGDRIIDVGTGAGLPGIPLSILHTEKTFCLLDSNQKKQIFVMQVVKSLELTNVQCVNSTVETYQAPQKFSTILTRAFAPFEKMITMTSHLLAQDGRFVAMLGKVNETLTVPPGYRISQLIPLAVPFEKGERHVAIVEGNIT